MKRALLAIVACTATAHAGGLVVAGGSPRGIGRAGVGTVADDGGGALLVNPAAIARRDGTRAQLGIALADDAIAWDRAGGGVPRGRDQAGPVYLPVVALFGSHGNWIFGAGVMTSAASDRRLRDPGLIPAEQYGGAFDYRYAGLRGATRRDTLTAGIARRIGDAVAIGASIGISHVQLAETRRIWAGFAGGSTIGDPSHDVTVAIAADAFSPSGTLGLFIAPPDTHLELAASASYVPAMHLSGPASAGGASSAVTTYGDPSARMRLPGLVTLRTGARWLAERWSLEVDADLWLAPASARSTRWEIADLTVADQSGVTTAVPVLPSRVSLQTHGAVRGAADVELISGFLWATAGYAFTARATSLAYLSPTFGDLGGHTVALGLEANAGGFTITLGWSRTWSVARFAPDSVWRLDNPFHAGDGPVPGGRYDGSADLIGILVDAELHDL
jgi:hypothetical protein